MNYRLHDRSKVLVFYRNAIVAWFPAIHKKAGTDYDYDVVQTESF